jgi:copper homeostasis protein
MEVKIILEICANSVDSAVAAQEGGADRVELCDNLLEGGTTPSYATLAKTRELLDIALYALIRPRGGDFLYDPLEFELMSQDIALCKRLGYDGVVIGLLEADGQVDKKRTRWLVELAWPMGVTFHRAFDDSPDPVAALEDIMEVGCERILTSGQCPTAPEGAELLSRLVRQAGDRLAIMAGSGIRPDNIAALVRQTRGNEFHSTAKVDRKSAMQHAGMLSSLGQKEAHSQVTDAEIVRELRRRAEAAKRPHDGPEERI